MIEDGRLPANRFGRCSYRISENSVDALVAKFTASAFNESLGATLYEKKKGRTK
jgi:hypothetical protein